ncbi:MAG TPA: enoyl-CoA hydratase-related protein [Candidatus Dormibacteraeota bacterium]|nr:enoyl-CoA hydratase-related protein [Candidatus Dormibacteraeota bacterium]
MSDPVSVQIEGRVALVTIDHPPANAISRAVVQSLRDAVAGAVADGEIRALVITGAGQRFFAAGADVSEFPEAGGDIAIGGQQLTLEIERAPLATIAAVNGMAFGGGCEIALACDVRIAAHTARLGQPEINLGIIPGWGGTQRLVRVVGQGRAMPLLLSGDPVDAQTALEIGLVSQVVEPDELIHTALALAERLAAKAPLALAATKRAVLDGMSLPIAEALEVERREFSGLFATADAREGVTAFLEKRQAAWTGR